MGKGNKESRNGESLCFSNVFISPKRMEIIYIKIFLFLGMFNVKFSILDEW